MNYEYKNVCVERGSSGSFKEQDAEFLAALDRTMNEMANQGWEYLNVVASYETKRAILAFRRPRK